MLVEIWWMYKSCRDTQNKVFTMFSQFSLDLITLMQVTQMFKLLVQ